MFSRLMGVVSKWFVLRAAADSGASDGGCIGTIAAHEALQAEEARYAAQTSGDYAALERMIGDDLVYIHSSTVVDTKNSFIESQRSGAVRYRSMNRGEVKVRTYGCVAIISGRLDTSVTVRGEDKLLKLYFHSVWAKRTGGPQFISWQATRLPDK